MKNPRLAKAGAFFALTFMTAALVWQNGRHAGLAESAAPPSSPTVPAPATATAFTDPATAPLSANDFARKIAEAIQRGEKAQTKEDFLLQAHKLYELARAAHFQSKGDGRLSLAAYREALGLFRKAGDRNAEAEVLLDLSDTQQLLGQTKDAERSLRAALALRESGVGVPPQHADTLFRFGSFLSVRGKYDEARTTLDHALRLQQRLRNEPGSADCLAALGQIACQENQLALARQILSDAARLFEKSGKTESRAAVLGQLGDVALKQGETTEAKRLYREGLRVWEARRQGFWTGRFLVRLAQVALQENDATGAKRLAEQGRQLLVASNGPSAQAKALLVLGQVAGWEGKPQDARNYVAKAQAIYQSTGNAFGLSECKKALKEKQR